jgi:hypothetical protein
MNWPQFWELFHRRWGSDADSPEYVKVEWKQIQEFLQELERRNPGCCTENGS